MTATVVIGFLGSTLDASRRTATRWQKWRPSVGLCMQPDLQVDRFVLINDTRHQSLAQRVSHDIRHVSPATRVDLQPIDLADPWDFEEVFGKLHDLARTLRFDTGTEEYLIHISTGTHVAQICLFLLTESRHLPGKLLQTYPLRGEKAAAGGWVSIDLDLSRYQSIATRFAETRSRSESMLKGGIETRNRAFNRMIAEIEQVAIHSRAPVMLMGPTGAGKSRLARRIYDLKRLHHQVAGPLVEVNCATLRGDSAMSALFGHRRGAFTGALRDRPGLLRQADGGLLFLDEIGDLGVDEQAMILRAVEAGRFLPMGADQEVESRFQLIAGTNRDLPAAIARGTFRDDLFARLNLWTFSLPGLAERPEDIPPNLDYELDRHAETEGRRVRFNPAARAHYLHFAQSPAAIWQGNFRDLTASVTRMATLSPGGRIDLACVEREIHRLQALWSPTAQDNSGPDDGLAAILPADRLAALDPFDRIQLAHVVKICQTSRTLSEAGRHLFAASRQRRKTTNDADRLRKYLTRFTLTWSNVRVRCPD